MILGIDASNIRTGGGITHLKELLSHSNPKKFGFSKIIIWASFKTLEQMPDQDWLVKSNQSLLNKSLPYRMLWKLFKRDNLIKKHCNILFVADSSSSSFHPFVTICHNQLPFDDFAIKTYPFSLIKIKLYMMRYAQLKAFRKSSGTIFLSHSSLNGLTRFIPQIADKSQVIYHGINQKIFNEKKSFDTKEKLQILYVSTINYYKFHQNVAAAVGNLISKGIHIKLTFIGSKANKAFKDVEKVLNENPVLKKNLQVLENVTYKELPNHYQTADIFVFASICETFGLILLEAMASKLPIACSNRSALPEILEDGGIYFDALSVSDIERALLELIQNKEKRIKLAEKANYLAKKYSWEKCSNETFQFIKEVYDKHITS